MPDLTVIVREIHVSNEIPDYELNGAEKINKDWNHLNQLEANTTIEIPVPTMAKIDESY